MIRHIVLWNLTDGDPRPKVERIREIAQKADELLAGLDCVRHLEIRPNLSDNPAHPDLALYSEFDDQAALDTYQPHPQHFAFKSFIEGKVRDRILFDAQA